MIDCDGVVWITLGETRTFHVRCKTNRFNDLAFNCTNGTIIVNQGSFQSFFSQSVSKHYGELTASHSAGYKGNTVILCFLIIKSHSVSCDAPQCADEMSGSGCRLGTVNPHNISLHNNNKHRCVCKDIGDISKDPCTHVDTHAHSSDSALL